MEKYRYVNCWSCGKELYTTISFKLIPFYNLSKECNECYDIKSREVRDNLMEIFEDFKKSNKLFKEVELLTDEKFDDLYKYLTRSDNINSGIWAKAFLGLHQSSHIKPIMISNNQALILFKFIEDNIEEHEYYRYIHAFGSYILYPSDLCGKDPGNIIYGYYGGKMKPTTKEQLIEIWSNKFQWLYNCDKFIINQCSICLDDIDQCNMIAKCIKCNNMFHKDCLHNYFRSCLKQPTSLRCIICQQSVTDDDIIYINFDMFYSSNIDNKYKRAKLYWYVLNGY